MTSCPPAPDTLPDAAETGGDEPALIAAAVAGNTAAFGQLVRRHQARVFNFVRQMTRHHQDAEDLTQQTFVKAWHHLSGFDLQRPLVNWLLTIARNTTRNHFRDVRRWEEMPAETASADPTPAHRAEEAESAGNLWTFARTVLSQREFEVMWLRFAEELSVRDTARIVGLTETHVKIIVFRARRALQKKGTVS